MAFYVVPQVQSFVQGDGCAFKLTRLAEIKSESEKAKNQILSFIEKVFEIQLVGTGRESIEIKIDKSVLCAEGYKLTVEKDKALIVAFDEAGAFYGAVTLCQLLLQGNGSLPPVSIEDYPTNSYRGFMLDCSRYFFSVEAVKLFLDAMAMHKLNVFHWHLTDDQGWRVQIDKRILLTEIGSYRAFTNFGTTPHSGYYTKEDIKEIVAYAHERCIKVIPEIDVPGHAVAAISAYPELSCFNRELAVATHTGVKHDVLCLGKESTFDFIFAVIDELCEMFTDKVIHIGGDEVPTMRWELCPNCQKRMKEQGLQKESELQVYFANRLAEYIESKGFKAVMWGNDFKGVKTEISYEYWNNQPAQQDLIADIENNRGIIDASSSAFYLDLPYGTVSLRDCYEHKTAMPEKAKKGCVGVEACLWTEYVPTMKKAGYCTFPRLGAFSEVAWTKQSEKSYDRFLQKLPFYYRLLDTLPFDYATKKQALPGFLRRVGYQLYFERRKLHWQGLHNLIDDNKVKKQAERNKNNG